MIGVALDPVGRHIVHEAGTMGQRGSGLRAAYVVVAAAIAFLFTRTAEPAVWLASVLAWEWAVAPVVISFIGRRWATPAQALNARAVLTGLGASLFAAFPLLVFPGQGVVGGMLSVVWIAGSITHAVSVLGVNRKLLVAGLVPVLAVAMALPVLQWGWSWEAMLVNLAFLSLFAASLMFAAESGKFVEAVTRTSATLRATSDVARLRAEVLALVSHELRTPAHAIHNYADLMIADSANDANLQVDLRRIQHSSTRLLDLIDRSIDIMRIRSGEVVLLRAPASIDALLSVITARWEQAAAARGNAILIESQRVGVALVDREWLTRAVECIVDNACKFTRGGRIVISCTPLPGCLQFTVADSGVGISEEARMLMFEPLQQGDMSATRTFEGAGLGLALADCIVGLMGGAIDVESAPGEGSAFTLTIPVPDAAEYAAAGNAR